MRVYTCPYCKDEGEAQSLKDFRTIHYPLCTGLEGGPSADRGAARKPPDLHDLVLRDVFQPLAGAFVEFVVGAVKSRQAGGPPAGEPAAPPPESGQGEVHDNEILLAFALLGMQPVRDLAKVDAGYAKALDAARVAGQQEWYIGRLKAAYQTIMRGLEL